MRSPFAWALIELPNAKALAFLKADFLYALSVLFEVRDMRLRCLDLDSTQASAADAAAALEQWLPTLAAKAAEVEVSGESACAQSC